MKNIRLQIIFIILINLCYSMPTWAANLLDLNFEQTPDKIILTFRLDTIPNYQIFYLANPTRLVIDFSNTNLTKKPNILFYIKPPLKNLRFGEHPGKQLRVVLDLFNKTNYNYFVKANNLILELFLTKQKPATVEIPAIKTVKHSTTITTKKTQLLQSQVAALNPSSQIANFDQITDFYLISNYGISSEIFFSLLLSQVPTTTPEQIAKQKESSTPQEEKQEKLSSLTAALSLTQKLIPSTQKPQSSDIIVVIDPGHGGKDPGAIGKENTQEKDIALAIAKYLQAFLNQESGFKAILTRDGDYFLSLRERLQIAHVNKANLFISIHADTYLGTDYTGGATIFALSKTGATSAAAKWLAEKENLSEGMDSSSPENYNLHSLLVKLAQKSSIDTSLQVGNAILLKLAKVIHLHKNRVEQASFIVLKSPDIPSLLIESGFISDFNEEKKLKDPQYQAKLAYAIALGIRSHFNGNQNNR